MRLSDGKKLRKPDRINIICEDENTDCEISFEESGNNLILYVTAKESQPKFIELFWDFKTDSEVKILGDTFERSYTDLHFDGLSESRPLPWYFMAVEGKTKTCFGVKTGCNSFVGFVYSGDGVKCCVDVRNGQNGVILNGRKLNACEFVLREYSDETEFEALQAFCKLLCDKPLSPKEPVYGGNNWYYAYGISSREEILSDAKLQAELAKGLPVKPYMVLDDGWQVNSCAGPWEPNARYGNMKSLVDEFTEMGVKAGIWVRFLHDQSFSLPQSYHFDNNRNKYLDPSKPEVLEHIRNTIRKIKSWGFTLIKHDFSTFDIFGNWGFEFKISPTYSKTVSFTFANREKTTAEIILDFYRTIKDEAGEDVIIIGCNTVSHLTAGLAELNRIGDDTSGVEWDRTRNYGVNTLAFRLCQHKAFYDADADCVGILGKNIPWKLNSQWLDLLAKSGTPLFVSCAYESATDEIKKDLRTAYEKACKQNESIIPVDFLWNRTPNIWKFNDEIIEYCWR